MVENVNETINFYHAVLGFEKVSSVPDEGEKHESLGGGFTLFLNTT